MSLENRIYVVQQRTPVNKAIAALLIFRRCSNAIAAYPSIKIERISKSMAYYLFFKLLA